MDLCKDALEILQETSRTFISQLVVYRQDCKKQSHQHICACAPLMKLKIIQT